MYFTKTELAKLNRCCTRRKQNISAL